MCLLHLTSVFYQRPNKLVNLQCLGKLSETSRGRGAAKISANCIHFNQLYVGHGRGWNISSFIIFWWVKGSLEKARILARCYGLTSYMIAMDGVRTYHVS